MKKPVIQTTSHGQTGPDTPTSKTRASTAMTTNATADPLITHIMRSGLNPKAMDARKASKRTTRYIMLASLFSEPMMPTAPLTQKSRNPVTIPTAMPYL